MDGNENIVHVETVENLMIQAKDHLGKIKPEYTSLGAAIEEATEILQDFQTGVLPVLRNLCEGD